MGAGSWLVGDGGGWLVGGDIMIIVNNIGAFLVNSREKIEQRKLGSRNLLNNVRKKCDS